MNGLKSVDLVRILDTIFRLRGDVETHTEIHSPLLRHETSVPAGGVDLRQNFLKLRDEPKVVTRVAQGSPTKEEADVQLVFAIWVRAWSDGAVPSRLVLTPLDRISNGPTRIELLP